MPISDNNIKTNKDIVSLMDSMEEKSDKKLNVIKTTH